MKKRSRNSRKKDEKPNILLLEATGRTGRACLRRFSTHYTQPRIHAFCQDSSKLCKEDRALCKSVVEGDMTDKADLKRALKESNANVVIVCIENGSLHKTRTASAHALVKVMKKERFKHVRAVVVSKVGASGSHMPIGLGIGTMMLYPLQFVLKDYSGQEKEFSSIEERVTIVRSTPLKDRNPTGMVLEFGEKDRIRKFRTPRDDLATWVTNEACFRVEHGSRIANITGARCA